MTYSMTFDNSWELMSEDEMYDVNGGGTWALTFTSKTIGIAVGAVSGVFIKSGVAAGLTALSVFLMGLTAIPAAASGGILLAITTPLVAAVVGAIGAAIISNGLNSVLSGLPIPSVTMSVSKWWIPGSFHIHI